VPLIGIQKKDPDFMATWWTLPTREDLGMRAQDLPGRPFAITNKGWYVLFRFLGLTGARNVALIAEREPYVPQRLAVHWGQAITNAGSGDWFLVGAFNGSAIVPAGIVHSSRIGDVEDRYELTPLAGTPMYHWLQAIGQELSTTASGYLVSGKPRKGSPMSVSLTKGAKIDVTKAAADAGNATGLDKISFRFGWDVRKGDGSEFDLDGSVVACDDSGNAVSGGFVFFNNLSAFSGAVVHQGDELTGATAGDDEIINVSLSQLPAEVTDIRAYVTIFEAKTRGNQTFSVVDNAFCRLVDEATGTELARFDLSEDTAPATNTICFAKLYLHNGAWQFKVLAEESGAEIDGIVGAHKIQL
jgi:tellurium resistance protein TerD